MAKLLLLGSLASTLLIFTGCSHPLPLDDAVIDKLVLASREDEDRFEKAQEVYERETCCSSVFSDRQGNVYPFGPGDYDKLKAFLRDHPEFAGPVVPRRKPEFPKLILSFQSPRMLAKPGSLAPIRLYYCDGSREVPPELDYFFAFGNRLFWRGRIASWYMVPEIEQALKTEGPQRYELVFTYSLTVYPKRTVSDIQPETISRDLCASFVEVSLLGPPRDGRPMRIEAGWVKEAIAPLMILSPGAAAPL